MDVLLIIMNFFHYTPSVNESLTCFKIDDFNFTNIPSELSFLTDRQILNLEKPRRVMTNVNLNMLIFQTLKD